MDNDKFKMRILAVFAIILLCIGVTIKELENDTFYIIKLGEYIVSHGIDMKDHFSWISNLSYTYPHWLYDVILYFIYFNFGLFGIYVSVIFLFIVLVLCIYFVNLKLTKNDFMSCFVSIISLICLGIGGFATARAQLITAILFLLEVFCLERLVFSGNKKYVFFLALISLLVANLHATVWLFYFILYLPFIGQYVIYKIVNLNHKRFSFKKNNKLIIDHISHFKMLVFSMIISILMGFFSPSKVCFYYVFKIMQGNSQNYIVEHAPLIVIQNPFFIIFILVVLFILIFSNTKIYLKELFMIGGLAFMSLFSARHVNLFYIIGGLYLSILCCRYFKTNHDHTLDILLHFIIHNKIFYFSLFFIVIVVSYFKFQNNWNCSYINNELYPIEAVNFILNDDSLDLDTIHLYNNYNIGSYLLFRDIPVFIDSRCDLYLPEFNGFNYSIFDDAVNIIYDYEEKFQFYGVTHVLVSNKDILCKLLLKDQNYNIIYQDKYFVLFEKGV